MSLKGNIKSMGVIDLFQWIEINRKTGVLVMAQEKIEKCFCFREGRIIFVSSRKEGERLGEFLSDNGNIDEESMKNALFKSRDIGIPFTLYLIDNRIVPKEFLMVAIEQLAGILFSDMLDWKRGYFEFIEGLPDIVSNGPVHLNTSYLMFETVRKHNEKMKEKDKQ
ncbi:hypothetical protein BMS3Abin07_00715 [bacterium BMS3Abin07]|nr:hypothetical protein BMS3Abin07_00715 [bacterium BMS3Abin07]GBE32996.1 hypothetical protein BMS3Bbin05_01928 [bacterium BMS3Bbin05]HDL20012.1 DUF4388 domain-containing protein [Nitrospirota bacterium]HDO22861.1 DUF4388 domain-containing protein [Nitrospirota bacterium]HDZ87418.1 DUF4388 domain-containing protein [Nitrospirota bacterium]